MCKWLSVKSHSFQAPWALGDGAAKGIPAGICGLSVALQTGVQTQWCLCKSLLLSLLPVLKVKAAVVEGLGKNCEKGGLAQKETSQHCLHKWHFGLTKEYFYSYLLH